MNFEKMNVQQKNQTIKTETQQSILRQQDEKLQKLILDLNKSGLKLLTQGNFDGAIQFFKKAQKILRKQVGPEQSNFKLIQLSGITYNNLACYYKKTKKPKVALKYLKKALEIEVYKLNNWTSIAGTHLNICAIYSYMKSHQQASNHAELAISFLQKVNYEEQDQSDEAKSYWNIFMLSYYNLAIEKQYLKDYQQSIKCYKKSKQIAQISGKRNVGILISCDESICRIEPMVQNLRKKMIQSIQKKNQSDEKGYAEFIRLNKKNFGTKKQNETQNRYQNQQKIANYLNRIAVYNDTTVTTAGNRFRSRKILNNSVRDELGSSFKKRVQSLTSFNNRMSSQAIVNNEQRKIRILTENDVQERDQNRQTQGKSFKKSQHLVRNYLNR